jgi:mannose PTS system EIID component
VTRLPAGLRLRVLARSLLVQGSWNYETLIGTGFAFVLLPVLRYIYRDDPEALRAAVTRHCEVFNSHPYLAPLAVGAVARLEAEGTPPEVTARFKNALRGPLGSLGDQLVWLAWRPTSALLAIALLLLGAPWWVAVGSFLVCYNAVHLWLRVWGFNLGLREGLAVGRVLREFPFNTWIERAARVGMVLAGLCTVLVIGQAGPGTAEFGIAAAAAVAGGWLGLRARLPAYVALLLFWAAGIVLGFTSS